MSLIDKLQSDRDTQISAVCIVFFVIAFPVYFGLAASLTDLGALPGPKGLLSEQTRMLLDLTIDFQTIGSDSRPI